MTNRFPNTPNFTGFNVPSRVEAEILDLEYDGELPPIRGTFYRAGPDPRYPPLLGDDINVNGDGMVQMYRFGDGYVNFRSRYVRTERFELESKAHRALFGMYRNPYTNDPSVRDKDGTTANTNAFFHAGHLFAMKEDGRPYDLDPDTLETRSHYDFGGKLQSQTMTAHPKIDPATGEMLAHGYEAKGLASLDIALQVISNTGELVREEFFQGPYASFMHDWAVSTDHFIFPLSPTTADDARMREGGPHWMYQPDLDAYVGIMRRDASVKDVRWFKVPNCAFGHIQNAFNDGNKVYLDIYVSEKNQYPFIGNADGSPFDYKKATPNLTRFMFDLDRNDDHFTSEVLFQDFMEMPVVDPRYALNHYRVGFGAILDRTRPLNVTGTAGFGWNTLVRFDLATGEMERFYVGDKTTSGEACFVPRGPDAPEGDGYLLAVQIHYNENPHSRLVILDTQRISEGPIATVYLPFRLHTAVHGNWVPEQVLNESEAS